MDHWHRPPPGLADRRHWAEWYYFNLVDPASGRYAYLSFLVAGDPWSGRALGSLSVQLGAPGVPAVRYVYAVRADSSGLPLDDVGVRLGAATVVFEHGRYVLKASFRDVLSGTPVDVDLAVTPEPRAYYPPIAITGADGFESGYVVPAAIARGDGTITVAGRRTLLTAVPAYHDHNWGVWRSVHWEWGQTQSADRSIALVYGAIHAPDPARVGESGRRYVLVTARDGFLGFLEPRTIEYAGWHPGPSVGGVRVRVPATIGLEAKAEDDSLSIVFKVGDVAATRPAGDSREAESARLGGGRVFLQMRGTYQVRGHVGGRSIRFDAPGAAETFVAPDSLAAR
jgi:hypothetical protein